MMKSKDYKAMLTESQLTKTEIKKLIEDELKKSMDKMDDKMLSKKDVKDMIRKSIVAQYKFLWEKSAFFINNI